MVDGWGDRLVGWDGRKEGLAVVMTRERLDGRCFVRGLGLRRIEISYGCPVGMEYRGSFRSRSCFLRESGVQFERVFKPIKELLRRMSLLWHDYRDNHERSTKDSAM